MERLIWYRLQQPVALLDAQDFGFSAAFTDAPDSDQFHRVLTKFDEFPAHRTVEQHSHEVVQMAFALWSHLKRLDPLLNGKSSHSGNWVFAPFRTYVPVQIRAIGISRRMTQIRQFFRNVPVNQ